MEDGAQVEVTLPVSLEISPGSELVLKNRVPEDFLLNSRIVFPSRQQSVEVYVEGKLIYAYPDQELVGGVVLSNENLIKLPEKYQDKEHTELNGRGNLDNNSDSENTKEEQP